MNTAKQLISAFVDAPPLYWDRSYVQNMREIRGYPNWWRIRDDVAYIDGPPNEGEQYTKDLFVWSVEVVKDEDTGENTNKLELYNLVNTLEESTTVVNGETVYRYKYREVPPELTYTHTDVIDSVSLEFDQLGRRMVAFESNGDVFLIWYDSQAGTTVVTNFGAGYNPQIVTDTYRRTGGSADSERFLFYVDNTTKQIVYRRQNDRYGVVYNLPQAPADVVEILKVSKNLYGGLTALYCYEDGIGGLVTGSFTARASEDTVEYSSDDYLISKPLFKTLSGQVIDFSLKDGLKEIISKNTSHFYILNGDIVDFSLRENTIDLENQTDSSAFYILSGIITDFDLKESFTDLDNHLSASEFSITSGDLEDFNLKISLVAIQSFGADAGYFSISSGNIIDFILG